MRKFLSFLLFALCVSPFAGICDTGVTEETVQALLKDMGDPGEAKLPTETQHALAFVKGASSEGAAFFIRQENQYYCVCPPELLVGNSNITIKDLKKDKVKPEGMECSSDGRLVRLKLHDRPLGSMKTANFKAGDTASLIELDYAKEKFTMYKLGVARRGEARIDLKELLPQKFRNNLVLDDEGNIFGFVYDRVQKNIGDLNSSTNRHVMSCVTSVTGVEEAKWEQTVKSFIPECGRLLKKEDTLFQASFLAWQWMHVTVFAPVKTNDFVKSEVLLAWVENHNKLAEKVSIEADKAKNKKGGYSKEAAEAVKKDANELKSAISKALSPGKVEDEYQFMQPAFKERNKLAEENKSTLLKGIDYMANHVASDLKPKK
ncbi:hypothetical protein J6U78_07080 [bacterium]|nr:hypothetical protein [bacterium]